MIRNETQSSIAGPATFGMAAMLLWGSYPLWYHAVAHVPVFELLLHRVIWSSMFIVPLTYLVFTKKDEVRRIVQSRKTLGLVVLSALVLSVWWLSYTYAVVSGHVLDASLGYFISPLLTVGSGVLIFKEKATSTTHVSIALSLVGVGYYVAVRGSLPIVALALAVCYTGYTILRKINKKADSQSATMVENLLLLPLAIGAAVYLAGSGQLVSYQSTSTEDAVLFVALGVINVLPMWWYGISTKGLSLLSISFLQYIPPTCNFLLAAFVFKENLDSSKVVMFSFVWAGIGLYLAQIYARSKK